MGKEASGWAAKAAATACSTRPGPLLISVAFSPPMAQWQHLRCSAQGVSVRPYVVFPLDPDNA
jgi:hypothetical protein